MKPPTMTHGRAIGLTGDEEVAKLRAILSQSVDPFAREMEQRINTAFTFFVPVEPSRTSEKELP